MNRVKHHDARTYITAFGELLDIVSISHHLAFESLKVWSMVGTNRVLITTSSNRVQITKRYEANKYRSKAKTNLEFLDFALQIGVVAVWTIVGNIEFLSHKLVGLKYQRIYRI
jgi:hypothetical protein